MPPEIWQRARALIFDFDGVLADSEPLYRDSYNEALAPYGHEIAPEEYWSHWSSKGEGLTGEIRRHGLRGIDAEAVEREQDRVYAGYCAAGRVPLFPEAPALLRLLLDPAAGRPLVVASNTARPLVERVLAYGGAPVPPIVGGEGLSKKPAPDIFLAAARMLGVAPQEALVVEDSEKGIRAARAGGFPVLLVRNRHNRRLRLQADEEVEGLAAVLGWVRPPHRGR